MNVFRNILVPTDFSPHSAEAFGVAQDLASATGAGVIVFHDSKPPAVASDGDRPLSTAARGESKDLWEELRKIQPKDPAVRVEHEVIVADHRDAGHILRNLHDRGCDLIVMGTQGRTGLRHLLFGSMTEEVLRKARCPVMVVKAPVPGSEAAPRAAASASRTNV
jgi:nucleotide-binding universal stress UspA family protein